MRCSSRFLVRLANRGWLVAGASLLGPGISVNWNRLLQPAVLRRPTSLGWRPCDIQACEPKGSTPEESEGTA